ncbi:MAG: cytochrome c oxidase subunit II [Crocinitomicaceae bacterium]|nr:cytochrome c oxidase subunit II [Crocinitomicaceae bacterium]
MEMKLIVLVVIVLVAIAVAQLMRVYELTAKIRNRREEEIDLRVNNLNAGMMIVFLAVFFGTAVYMLAKYGNGMLPEAASELGRDIDWLFNINWIIVFAVFFATNAILFIFAYKYAYHPDRKAYFFPHDNRLEMIWTVVPAAALAVIIILGLMTWNKITGKASDDAVVVELYAEQFSWTARYSGEDNKLGYSDYKLVTTFAENPNPLGVITTSNIEWRLKELDLTIDGMYADIDAEDKNQKAFSKAASEKMRSKVEKLERIRERVVIMKEMYTDSTDLIAADDYTAKELFLIKDQEYQFILRSRDVIHSAYFPHFRAQMNCVPGQRTKLKVKPIYTTSEMRERTGNPEFNFILMCNKICGESHSNMKMSVVVGTAEEFIAWKEAGNTNLVVAHEVPAGE